MSWMTPPQPGQRLQNIFTFSALIWAVEAIAPIIKAAQRGAAQIKAGEIFWLIDILRHKST